ncbi:HipA N-terminal domain-containing protein [Hymenobacter artigasi]|uniref:Serine/threonine-protein kinase HipA n=1 Tax=Hymenobacter artigasi TaxID=2719616 RepID=A0ABX1HFE0_9BACT|nr:HipA N-terminal domain-containing protein [Hymenobacter artigasi]NKI87802.1 serine/threonine-protein kinase HipA [Hymenobacter artigasi]
MKRTVGEVLYNGVVAGNLRQTGAGFVFRYHSDYLLSAHPPISLTLPKQPAAFVAPVLFAFFAGLLAEGTAKDLQCRTLHLDEKDYFTRLLLTAHSETIGAVTVRAIPEDLI